MLGCYDAKNRYAEYERTRAQQQVAHQLLQTPQQKFTIRAPLLLIVLLCLLFVGTRLTLAAVLLDQAANQVIYLPLISDAVGAHATPPVIHFFRATPATINPGDTTTLTWDVTGSAKVSIEGLGDMTGTNIVVKPATTTIYTLIATSQAAAVVEKTTVTVTTNNGVSANFFLPYDLYDHIWSNRLPQLVIDSQGVTHIAYVATSNSAVFYGYCMTNCTSQASFQMSGLGLDMVSRAQLAVDPAGHPRLLLSLEVDGVLKYRYAECNSNCTQSEQWFVSDDLVDGKETGSSIETERAFAIDAQGQPRFVHSIWTVNGTDTTDYLYCNTDCTVSGNWQQVTLLNAFAENLSLQIAPSGMGQVAYYAKTQDQQGNILYKISYLECTTVDCTERVGPLDVAQVSSGAAAFALRLDSAGHPRMALYPGNGEGGVLVAGRLYYLSCDSACAQNLANWWALDIGLPSTVNGQAVYHGELGVDLALDHQDRPRLAFRIWPYAELGYAWCNQNDCATAATGWHEDILPSTQAADQELGHIRYSCPTCFPPVADCASYWDAGWWPTLAIHPTGDAIIAFEAQLWSYGGACSAQALARFSRLAIYPQPAEEARE